jgi:glutathione S-transferase
MALEAASSSYRGSQHRSTCYTTACLQLEEKRIPYTIEKINMRCYGDKPPSFLAKVRQLQPMLWLTNYDKHAYVEQVSAGR